MDSQRTHNISLTAMPVAASLLLVLGALLSFPLEVVSDELRNAGPWGLSGPAHMIGAGSVVVAGSDYGLYCSEDFGRTWKPVSFLRDGDTRDPVRVGKTLDLAQKSVNGDALALVRTSYGNYLLEIGASCSEAVQRFDFRYQEVKSLWTTDALILVERADDKILLSRDGGGSFDEITIDSGVEGFVSFHIMYAPQDPSIIAIIEPLNLPYPSVQVFYRSIDGGATWTPFDAGVELTSIDSAYVNPADGAFFLVATTQSYKTRIFRSSDFGASWEDLGESQRVDGLWSHCGETVYLGRKYSSDGGRTWRELPKNSAHAWGLVRAPVVQNPGNQSELLGASGTGVLLSTDSGGAWTESGAGIDELSIASSGVSQGSRKVLVGTQYGAFLGTIPGTKSRSNISWTRKSYGNATQVAAQDRGSRSLMAIAGFDLTAAPEQLPVAELLVSNDNGLHFDNLTLPQLTPAWDRIWEWKALAVTKNGTVFAVTRGGDNKILLLWKKAAGDFGMKKINAEIGQLVAFDRKALALVSSGKKAEILEIGDTGRIRRRSRVSGCVHQFLRVSRDRSRIFLTGLCVRYSTDSARTWKTLKSPFSGSDPNSSIEVDPDRTGNFLFYSFFSIEPRVKTEGAKKKIRLSFPAGSEASIYSAFMQNGRVYADSSGGLLTWP